MSSLDTQDESKRSSTSDAASGLPDNTMSQSHPTIIEMTAISQGSHALHSLEDITLRVQDGPGSKLAGDGLPQSSNMTAEQKDLAISKALDELHEHTMSLVHPTLKKAVCVSCTFPPEINLNLETIQLTVKRKGEMDNDCLNLAIRKIAKEKSGDGDPNNSNHYISSDLAMFATSTQVDHPNLTLNEEEFVCLGNALRGRDKVLCVPVICDNHWTLFAFKMKDKKLSILDSLLKHDLHKRVRLDVCKALAKALAYEYDFCNWKVDYLQPERVPQQEEGSNDCGFFVFKFMRHWNGYELVGSTSWETMELRKEFLAYILSYDGAIPHGLPGSLDELKKMLPSPFSLFRCEARLLDPKVHYSGLQRTLELKEELPGSATTASIPSTSRDIDSARPPLYKFIPVTKILVEPCKELKSPFLVKRQSFCRPDAKILENLYQDTTADKLHIWQGPGDIQKLMKDGQSMDAVCLNLAVNNMGREDAQDFRNTKCLGWRHYVDSDWAKNSLGGCSDLRVLHFCFHRGSILYNASQSHVVFIPVNIHGAHWSLYAFNMCDRKLSILDSLPDTTEGVDSDPVERHQKTRCDVCDALTITMNYAIDFRSWEYEFPKLPRQQNSCDSGFFVLNFMRLWDGRQLVRGFSTESKELRKDFLAYILTCKDNNVHLPNEVLLKIKDLPGKMMDCAMQKVARKGSTLRGFLDGGLPGSSSVRQRSQPQASKIRRLRALPESPSFFWKLTKHVLSPENQQEHGDVVSSNNATSDQMIIDVIAALASSDFLPFLNTCHRVTSDGDGMLHIAARFGNVLLVHDILDNHGALAALLVTAVNNIGDTILHCAAAGGCDEIVKLFVEDMGSSMFLRAQNLKGETCLHQAVRHGHVGIVETLILEDSKIPDLGRPTLVQIVNNAGISPLYLAATLRRIEIVQALTKKLYRQDDKYAASFAGPAGKTALHAAVVLLDKELIAILLDWNASLTSQGDESGSTPLHYLASLSLERTEPNSLVLSLYRSGNMRINGTNMVALAQAPARMGFLLCSAVVLRLYKRAQGSGVLYKPLQYSDNTWKLVQDSGTIELVLRKDPLSALYVDCTGSLPIHIAAAHGRLDTVKKLLEECPCCDSSRNASGQTILHIAVEKENLSLVRYVCGENKFNRILNMEDQDGNTALHLAVNNACEKIFCTLMQNRDVCLNYANKQGHTPLDLAFLSLHPELKRMQGPREWIFFDLLHGGGDFGVCSWDHLTSNVAEADWEKESESVGKSASMMAVCAVLIMNASLLTPFQVLNHNQNKNPLAFHEAGFQAFVLFDTISFVCSAAATYFCACAGFTMSDGSMRLENLITGTYALVAAALTWICTVALALSLVLPGQTFFRPIIVAGACVLVFMLLSLAASKFNSSATHLAAIRARVGSTSRVNFVRLIGRNAIKPLWVVPSASKVLFLSVWLGLVVFIYQLPLLLVRNKSDARA